MRVDGNRLSGSVDYDQAVSQGSRRWEIDRAGICLSYLDNDAAEAGLSPYPDLEGRPGDPPVDCYFQRKCTNTRPKFLESFSTR